MTAIEHLYDIDEVQRVAYPEDIKFIVIDLFCGAGGTTTGITQARNKKGNPIALVAACINHDPDAIDSHWANHPEVAHYEEDIRTLPISPLRNLILKYREAYPWAKIVLWASLECTNFSKAKGGQSRDADSRTLANSLFRYIYSLNPDYIKIENVVEFMAWGPLDDEGKPVSMKKGEDFEKWRKHIKKIGYVDQWKTINSADLGARTTRDRLFGCFAKPGLRISWPELTHDKKGRHGRKKWKAVRPLLWLDDRGTSIFNRKKPLVDNTLKRLISGMKKYHNDKACIIKNYGGHPESKARPIDNPLGSITTKDSHSLAFIMKYNSLSSDGKHTPPSIDNPMPVITTQNRLGLAFMYKYYGTGENVHSLQSPAGTITTKDRMGICWIDKQYSGPHNHSSINSPAGTIMVSDKHQLVTASIYNPSHGGHFMHIDQPCPTIIARQDKAPLYLMTTNVEGDLTNRWIKPGDSNVMKELKKLMFELNICEVSTRMLYSEELKVIQGFPSDYKLVNGSTAAKKGIGNSVVPLVCKKWFESFLN